MSQQVLTIAMLILPLMLSLMGCVSSEETGAGDRAKTPVQIFGPIDTTHHANRYDAYQDSMLHARSKVKSLGAPSSRVAPKFKSKQDTVRVSVIKKSKSFARSHIKIDRPKHPIFTVQIGAFSQASNALRTQKKAKVRFIYQPVFNRYIKKAQLYRVSVGRYKDRKEAYALADTMKQEYPKEYGRCWINFIP